VDTRAEQIKRRAKQFALCIIGPFRALPRTAEAQVIGRQLLRSGTAAAANYRGVCRARSKAEFVAKIGVVVEETDETVLWLEMLVEAGIIVERTEWIHCSRKPMHYWRYSQLPSERPEAEIR
jgi:four helix bundle protein